MQIEGLIAETKAKPDGLQTVRLYREEGSRRRHIKLEQDASGGAIAELIEGSAPPGLDLGERFHLGRSDDVVCERLVRAMATYHLGVEEAANGYTAADLALIVRGYEIRFSQTGLPYWVKNENGLLCMISKPGETGLPASAHSEVQAKITAAFNSQLLIAAPNLQSLLTFIEDKEFLAYMRPNTQASFTVMEQALH